MIGKDSAAPAETLLRQAAVMAGNGDYCTLLLDGVGTILSGGTAAGRLFGGELDGFVGKPVSALISGFGLSAASLSYSARHIAYLCAEGGWLRFTAVDVRGGTFPVDISLSRVRSDGQDLVLMNLHRADAV